MALGERIPNPAKLFVAVTQLPELPSHPFSIPNSMRCCTRPALLPSGGSSAHRMTRRAGGFLPAGQLLRDFWVNRDPLGTV